VHAQVAERADLAVQPDDDQRLVEQPSGDRRGAQVGGPHDRVPEPAERRVQSRLAHPIERVVRHAATVHGAIGP
jgi:hypothetical protein